MSDQKWIMVLGGGVMQLPALRIIAELGWRAIVVDGSPEAPGKKLAAAFEHIDLKDYKEIAERAKAYLQRGELDGVFTAGTDFSTSVAYVCDRLGLPGNSFETAQNARDKVRMRQCFYEHSVPSPRYFGVTEEELTGDSGIESRAAELTPPLIVKPVDNMGARGVRQVSRLGELRERVRDALRYSASGRVIIEEQINGPEFSLDAIVYRGEVTVCGIADRHIFFSPYFVEMGHTIPASLNQEEEAELIRVFTAAITALGITNGAAKGDIFLSDRGGVVGEVAARLSGGYMSGWTYPLSSGVEVTKAALRIAAGMDPGSLTPTRAHTSAERAFISLPGRATKIEGIEAAEQSRNVRELFSRVEVGKRVRFPRNNVEKCGNIITSAPSREEAIRSAERAVANILIVLEPDDEESMRFLFDEAESEEWSAFSLDERARAALSSVPFGTLDPAPRYVHPMDADLDSWGRDWCYRTLSECVEGLFSRRGLQYAAPGAMNAYGRELWYALFTGGLQGGLFLVDSINTGGKRIGNVIDIWERERSDR